MSRDWLYLLTFSVITLINYYVFETASLLLHIYSVGIPAVLGFLFFLIPRIRAREINFITLLGVGHLIQFILAFLILTPFYYGKLLYLQDDLLEMGPGMVLATLVGQLFLFVGYYGNKYKSGINSVFTVKLKNKINSPKGYILLLLIIYIPIWIARYVLFSTGSYYHSVRSDFQFESWLFSPLAQISLFNSFVIAVFFMLYYEVKENSPRDLTKIKVIIFIIMLLELIWTVPSGSRETTLFVLIVPFIVFYKYSKGLPKKLIIVFSILIIFYLTIAKIYQSETIASGTSPNTLNVRSTAELVQKSFNQIEEGSNIVGYQFYLPFVSRIWDGLSLSIILSRYDIRYEKEMGNTYLGILNIIIPRFIYPDKPGSQLALNDWFPEIIFHGSMPTTFIGESYINFGWAGIVVISIIVGFLVKYLDVFFIKRSQNIIWSALYISLVLSIMRLTVQPLRIWISSLVYSIIFGLVITFILNNFIIKTTHTRINNS